MKRFFVFFAVFFFGGLAFFLINQMTSPETVVEYKALSEPTPFERSSYISTPAVNGPDFSEAAESTVDAVVHIRSQFRTKSREYDDFFGALREYFGYENSPNRNYPISGWGSGVILSHDGYIVTNNHVVEGAELIEVILNDKRVFEGEVVGLDPTTDLALLRIDVDDLPTVRYGNSDNLRVGEWVLAVGNPFNLTSTVTAGIVSAKARNINILGSQGAIESFIQTDAAVNRGNSGGALVNTRGELVGINAAIASNTGYYQGYSFAIPVNIVRKVIEDLKKYGEVQRAYIGVVIREINQRFADELDLDEIRGVYVDGLSEDGGAMDAGIEIGDVITTVDGTEVNSLSQLLEVVGQHSPGDKLAVQVIRDGEPEMYNVELRTVDGTTNVVRTDDEFFNDRLGAYFSGVSSTEKSKYNIRSGLKIISIEGGLLEKGGIRKNFIVTSVNGYAVDSKSGLESALDQNDERVKISGLYPNGMKVTFEFGL